MPRTDSLSIALATLLFVGANAAADLIIVGVPGEMAAKSIPATSRGRFVLVRGRVARSERSDGRGELRTDLHPVRTY